MDYLLPLLAYARNLGNGTRRRGAGRPCLAKRGGDDRAAAAVPRCGTGEPTRGRPDRARAAGRAGRPRGGGKWWWARGSRSGTDRPCLAKPGRAGGPAQAGGWKSCCCCSTLAAGRVSGDTRSRQTEHRPRPRPDATGTGGAARENRREKESSGRPRVEPLPYFRDARGGNTLQEAERRRGRRSSTETR
jgi:hypothetical protein